MIKNNLIVLLFLISSVGFSQNEELLGKVLGKLSIESIHVINKSQNLFAITTKDGKFKIEAKTGDTIIFSSVQYKLQTEIVTVENIKDKILEVTLQEYVNELPEAVIGFTLTGDLTKDVASSRAKPTINFYDVGIPGYKGKPKTKSERLLNEAGEFKSKMLLGLLIGSVPLNPILNGISGRTKSLKKRVKLEANEVLMYALKGRLLELFLKDNPLKEELVADFFYFCAEDDSFVKSCGNSDFEALIFMKEKYKIYQNNLKSKN